MKLDKIDRTFIFVFFVIGLGIVLLYRYNDIFPMGKPINWNLFWKQFFISIPIGLSLSFLSVAYKKLVNKHNDAINKIETIRNEVGTLINSLKAEINTTNNILREEINTTNNKLRSEVDIVKNDLSIGIQKVTYFNKDTLNLFFRNNPFDFFSNTSNHTGVIGSLIEESLKTGFTKLTGIFGMKYLGFIQEAIKNTKSFCGVNINSIRWFIEGGAGVPKDDVDLYNKCFMDNKDAISPKRRIFILSEASGELQKMKEDLENHTLLEEFKQVSQGIQTFWISEKDLLENMKTNEMYKLSQNPIYDFGIYDKLIIKFSYNLNELDYKEITSDDDEYKIYNFFSQHFQTYNKFKPFHPIFIFDNGTCIFDIKNGDDIETFYKSVEWRERIKDKNFKDTFINHRL